MSNFFAFVSRLTSEGRLLGAKKKTAKKPPTPEKEEKEAKEAKEEEAHEEERENVSLVIKHGLNFAIAFF